MALVKRSELRRRTPMPRGTTKLERTVRVRPQSDRRKAEAPLRRAFVVEVLTERPWCEIRWDDGCTGRAVDVDELLSRAQGGSILDPDNVQTACRYCHDRKHAHPDEAAARGLTVRRRKDLT